MHKNELQQNNPLQAEGKRRSLKFVEISLRNFKKIEALFKVATKP